MKLWLLIIISLLALGCNTSSTPSSANSDNDTETLNPETTDNTNGNDDSPSEADNPMGEEPVEPIDEPAPTTSQADGVILLSQDFAGLADGSPWPGWVPANNSPVTFSEIQNERACLEGPEYIQGVPVNGYPINTSEGVLARMIYPGLSARDVDMYVKVQYENFHHQGIGLYGRQNGGFLTTTAPLGQGYVLFLEGGFQKCLGLWYELAGIEEIHECEFAWNALGLTQPELDEGTFPDNPIFHMRHQIEQISATETIQRGKIWLEGTDEPTEWHIISDANPDGAPVANPMAIPALNNLEAGFALDLFNYTDNDNLSLRACFDEIIISDLHPDPINGIDPVSFITGGFGFTEGPVWHADTQKLWFTDITNDRIHQLDPSDDSISLIRDTQIPPRHGNGLALNNSGDLLICEMSSQAIIQRMNDGSETTLADLWMGNAFNSPNDLVMANDNTLYFTDPTYGTLFNGALIQNLGFRAVYRRANDGTLSIVADDFVEPNGIALSPQHDRLYVSDYSASQVRAFTINPDGSTTEIIGTGFPLALGGGGDGMAIDKVGNIYVATNAGVSVYDKRGISWGLITVPETTTNVAFGGADLQTLYITAGSSLYRVQVNVPGL